jgi:hypothetical protein
VELVSLDPQLAEFLGRDLLAGRIVPAVEPCAHYEATSVRGVADETDDRLVGSQRSAAPVDRDEGEQAVFDLVPLACARREVADVDRELELVGDALELLFPYMLAAYFY